MLVLATSGLTLEILDSHTRGFGDLRVQSASASTFRGYLYRLVVHPDHRRHGIARHLGVIESQSLMMVWPHYTDGMRSVADQLREDTRTRVASLDLETRIDLAFRLGEDDLAAVIRMHGLSRDEARQMFARARSAGRLPSVSNT